jgi:hypothetical protein
MTHLLVFPERGTSGGVSALHDYTRRILYNPPNAWRVSPLRKTDPEGPELR